MNRAASHPWIQSLSLAAVTSLACAAGAQGDPSTPDGKEWSTHQQEFFDRVQLKQAWEISRGDPSVLVGIIDTGFDFFHPDLVGQLTPGYYYSGGFHSESFSTLAHGTEVASIIAAKDDGKGMVGLAPRCRVITASQGMIEHLLLKLQRQFFTANPGASLEEFQEELMEHSEELHRFGEQWIQFQVNGAADAIRYLVKQGVQVINISGALKRSMVKSQATWDNLEAAVWEAAEQDVILVLGAGNSAAHWEDYPGNERHVLIVGSSLLDDTRWEEKRTVRGTQIVQGSCYGKRLSLLAPSQNMVVCSPHAKRFYEIDAGPEGPFRVPFQGPYDVRPTGATSLATPVVTSLVALIGVGA